MILQLVLNRKCCKTGRCSLWMVIYQAERSERITRFRQRVRTGISTLDFVRFSQFGSKEKKKQLVEISRKVNMPKESG